VVAPQTKALTENSASTKESCSGWAMVENVQRSVYLRSADVDGIGVEMMYLYADLRVFGSRPCRPPCFL
jgi:hypothetical protein